MPKAWKVTWRRRDVDIPNIHSVVEAKTRSQAKWRAYSSAREAGFNVHIKDFHAIRLPEWDDDPYLELYPQALLLPPDD